MTDCLIIGFNDGNLDQYVSAVRSMGEATGAYKDLQLAIIYHEGKTYRATDILNHFYWQKKGFVGRPFHNADFLWPAITYLGTYLQRRGIKFDYVNLFHLEKEKLREKLLHNSILSIAITTTLYVSPEPIFEIISFIRQYNQTAKIIVGGPFISNQAKNDRELLEGLFVAINADFYVISSEGEATLAELVRALRAGGSVENINNISYRSYDGYVFNSLQGESNSLEENIVDYSLFPRAEIDQFVTTRTAKSCPFSCAFCGFPQRAGQYTYMGVEAAERELNSLRELGNVTTLTFIDDTFNVPKARFKEILRMMIRNKYEFKWNCLYRSDHGDEEAIELMGRAGCEGVFLGVESGSDRMLEKMNKSARRKDYLKAIPLLRNAGISTYASLIIGFPGETYDTVQETISLVEEAQPEYFRAQLWYCDPVTPIWKKREEFGIRGSGFQWTHETMDVKTACTLIDRMFLCVEGSIWLPQFGFEQWSTFYLQRRGMGVEQIHVFLRCFNEIIKERLLNPKITEASPVLMERLKKSCNFDQQATPTSVETYDAASYNAAENFWIQEFGQPVPSILAKIQGYALAPSLGWTTVPLEGLESRPAQPNMGLEASVNFLAAFCIFLGKLVNSEDICLLSVKWETQRRQISPLRITLAQDLNYNDIINSVRRKIALSNQHREYSRHILSSPAIMGIWKASCPVFEVGWIYSEEQGMTVSEILAELSEVSSLGLLLVTLVQNNQISYYFAYQCHRFSAPLSRKLTDDFLASYQALSADADAPIADLSPARVDLQVAPSVNLEREQTFNFDCE